ncbi:hypothetical protein ABZ820_37790 [Streptomyces diacarni]|uniref:hypothetical protein n=1 Tax=Streptomyces diacarni TaxID=2800381 RepID=UPI0033E110AD
MDHSNPDGAPVCLRGTTTLDPEQAVGWIREAARDVAWMLDRRVFAQVWAWLGDHPGAAAAVAELGSGRPFDFQFGAGRYWWTLLARPVSLLHLTARCHCLEQVEEAPIRGYRAGL